MTADIPADIPLYQSPQISSEAQALLSQGIDYARSREFDRAIALFTQVIHRRLANSGLTNSVTIAKGYYHRGCALCNIQQYGQAIADFSHVIEHNRTPASEKILSAEPVKSIETYIHRGNAHRHLGNYPLALTDLTQGVERSGGSAQSYGARGLLRLDMEDFAGAIADFDRALTLHPTFAQGYLWRGFAWLRDGQPDLALMDLTHAIEAIPTCAEAYNHRGVAHFYLNAFEAARADFDHAIQQDRQFVEAYNNRGNLLQLMGDRTAAALDFDKAIALDPSLAQLYLNRSAALCPHTSNELADIAADYDQAAELFFRNAAPSRTAHSAAPRATPSAAFYRHRAQARVSQGKLPAAIADYTAAIAITPSAYAHYHRGQAHVSLGQLDEALKDFDGAIALSQDYGAPYGDRAKLRLKLNDFEGALTDASRAIALGAPNDKDNYTTRALAYFGLGQPQQAMEAFNQLMEISSWS